MAKGIYKLSNGKYRWHIMIEGQRFYGVSSNIKEAEQARAKKLSETANGIGEILIYLSIENIVYTDLISERDFNFLCFKIVLT